MTIGCSSRVLFNHLASHWELFSINQINVDHAALFNDQSQPFLTFLHKIILNLIK